MPSKGKPGSECECGTTRNALGVCEACEGVPRRPKGQTVALKRQQADAQRIGVYRGKDYAPKRRTRGAS